MLQPGPEAPAAAVNDNSTGKEFGVKSEDTSISNMSTVSVGSDTAASGSTSGGSDNGGMMGSSAIGALLGVVLGVAMFSIVVRVYRYVFGVASAQRGSAKDPTIQTSKHPNIQSV